MTSSLDVFYQLTVVKIARHLEQALHIVPNRHYVIMDPVEGAHVLTIPYRINASYLRPIQALEEQLSFAAELDAGQTIRVTRGAGGRMVMEVPKPDDLCHDLYLSALPAQTGLAANIGLTTTQDTAVMEFGDPLRAHLLIAGITGGGKTNAAQAVLVDLLSHNRPDALGLLLMDVSPKNAIGWRLFDRAAHLIHPLVSDLDQAERVLAWLVAEIARRSDTGQSEPAIFLGIDEAQEAMQEPRIALPLKTISATGRQAGVHVIAIMQNPSAKQLGGAADFKRNFPVRVVTRTDSADASKTAAGVSCGAEHLCRSGDVMVVDGGRIVRAAAPLVRDIDARAIQRGEVRILDLAAGPHLNPEAVAGDRRRGRPPDDIDMNLLVDVMLHYHQADRAIVDALHIGYPKVKTYRALILAFCQALDSKGLKLCRINGGLRIAQRNTNAA